MTSTALEASIAKCMASDTAMKVTTDAVQIFGDTVHASFR